MLLRRRAQGSTDAPFDHFFELDLFFMIRNGSLATSQDFLRADTGGPKTSDGVRDSRLHQEGNAEAGRHGFLPCSSPSNDFGQQFLLVSTRLLWSQLVRAGRRCLLAVP